VCELTLAANSLLVSLNSSGSSVCGSRPKDLQAARRDEHFFGSGMGTGASVVASASGFAWFSAADINRAVCSAWQRIPRDAKA
jgi:hypothetical protein